MIRCSTTIRAVCLLLLGLPGVMTPSPAAAEPTPESVQTVEIVPASDALLETAAEGGDLIRRLVNAAKPTIGVPYEWGGSQLRKGIDCSNYTWRLCRKIGLRYDRYLNTKALSRLTEAHGLRQIPHEEAAPGDLLVYGYWDETNKWHGHVVILVDKDGRNTGHKGLVLGAHGPPVDQVQFITFTGFDEGFYKTPQKRLRNVLRLDDPRGQKD